MAEFFGDFHVILRLNSAGKLGSTFRQRSRAHHEIIEPNPTKKGLTAGTRKAGNRSPEIVHSQTTSQGSISREDAQAMDDSAVADTTTESSYEKFNDGNNSLRWI